MSYTVPQLMMLFLIYAFLGWCVEVAFAACCEGRFVNRGFLNGPVCPIYGFGVILVVLLLEPVKGNLPTLFVGSIVVTTAIEFVAGFLLEKLFHAKWWDYSDMPLNIMGYVCLPFSILWGLACLVVVRFVHPMVFALVGMMPFPLLVALLCVFGALMLADLIATVATIRKLNERLKRLTELANEIHALSDEIGQAISDGTLAAKSKAMAGEERFNESMRRLNERKAETEERIDQSRRVVTERIDQSRKAVADRIEQSRSAATKRLSQLKAHFATALDEKTFGQKRLISAFPNLKSLRHQEALAALRKNYARSWRDKKNRKSKSK